MTFLVGENGSGKSTLVEGIAMAYGLGSEGGSTGSRHGTRGSESPLSRSPRLQRGLGSGRWGFFLRAETMHGLVGPRRVGRRQGDLHRRRPDGPAGLVLGRRLRSKWTQGDVVGDITLDGDAATVFSDGGLLTAVGPVTDGGFLTLSGSSTITLADLDVLAPRVRRP